MEKVQFKTNIKCSGCIATVTPALNEVAGEKNWEVDLQSPDKTLTVIAGQLNASDVKKAVERAGFKAEEIKG